MAEAVFPLSSSVWSHSSYSQAISHTLACMHTYFPSTSYSWSISTQSIQIPEHLCLAFMLCWVSNTATIPRPEGEQGFILDPDTAILGLLRAKSIQTGALLPASLNCVSFIQWKHTVHCTLALFSLPSACIREGRMPLLTSLRVTALVLHQFPVRAMLSSP